MICNLYARIYKTVKYFKTTYFFILARLREGESNMEPLINVSRQRIISNVYFIGAICKVSLSYYIYNKGGVEICGCL